MTEVIVAVISRTDSDLAIKADLELLRADAKAEISSAINKMLIAQLAVAGLLFTALKLF